MQIYGNVRKRLHKKKVQLPQDWFATPTWPPFYCFGTPIWPSWWKFFPNSACSYWLLRVHMTSNSDAVSRQNLWAGNIAKSMPSEGNSCYPWMLTARERFIFINLYTKKLFFVGCITNHSKTSEYVLDNAWSYFFSNEVILKHIRRIISNTRNSFPFLIKHIKEKHRTNTSSC